MAKYVVAPLAEVPPGERTIVELVGRSVGVFSVGGEIFALRNRCPLWGTVRVTGQRADRWHMRYSAHERVLSTRVGQAGQLGNEGVLKQGGAAGQAMDGVPVTARQVAQRSSRCWR